MCPGNTAHGCVLWESHTHHEPLRKKPKDNAGTACREARPQHTPPVFGFGPTVMLRVIYISSTPLGTENGRKKETNNGGNDHAAHSVIALKKKKSFCF